MMHDPVAPRSTGATGAAARGTRPDGPAGGRRAASVRLRVVVFAVLMSTLLLAVAVPAVLSAQRQSEQATRLTTMVGPAVDANHTVRGVMNDAQIDMWLAVAVPEAGPPAEEDIEAYQQQTQDAMRTLDHIFATDDYSHSAVARERMLDLQEGQRAALDDLWSWAMASRDAPLIDDTATQVRGTELFARFVTANDDVSAALEADRAALRAATREGGERTQAIVLLSTAIALVLAALATIWTVRSLTRPIRDLRDTVRRQREGHRDMWASTDSGAREVRELAADVNALTAAHLALLDEQAMRLAFERAEWDLGLTLRDCSGMLTALRLTGEVVAENLGVDHVVSLSLPTGGIPGELVDHRSDDHQECPGIDPGAHAVLASLARDLWGRDERLVRVEDLSVDEVRERLTPYVADGTTQYPRGAALVAPIGLRDRPIGLLVVHDDRPGRTWRDAELSLLEGAADALGRFVVQFEVDRDREDYVHRLEALDEQKDVFLSTVSHELRTPLTSIAGYLEMLKDGDAGELTSAQTTMLDVIDRNAIRLRALIEDLLVITRIQTGAASTTSELVDIGELVRQTVQEVRPSADRQGVTLRSSTASGALVMGDRATLTRALTNVLANAVKFTPAGGDIDLVAAIDAQTRAVNIVCSDTGMGIPEADMPRLFQRFFRASNAADAQIQGTGLGLAIVKGIVESHGGTLDLTSTEQVGTTVSMTLPGAVRE